MQHIGSPVLLKNRIENRKERRKNFAKKKKKKKKMSQIKMKEKKIWVKKKFCSKIFR